MISKHLLSILILVGCLQLSISFASADFTCNVEVSYKWRKKGDEGEPKKVLWKRVVLGAKEESKAKQIVTDRAKEEVALADNDCRKGHEDLASCMASKFHSSRSLLQTLSFKARKDLEDAIVTGCKEQEGVCSNAEISDPLCEEKIAEAEPSPTEPTK